MSAEEIVLLDPRSLAVTDDRATAAYEEHEYAALRASIEAEGIRVPLDVVRVDGQLIITDGFNRSRIALELGLDKVPCRVRDGTLKEARLENLVRNVQRGKARPADLARVVLALHQEDEMPDVEIAAKTGFSSAWVKKLLRLGGLHPYILDALDKGHLAVGVAMELAAVPSHDAQVLLMQRARNEGWTIDYTKQIVSAVLEEQAKPPEQRRPVELVTPALPTCELGAHPVQPHEMKSALCCVACWGLAVATVRDVQRATAAAPTPS